MQKFTPSTRAWSEHSEPTRHSSIKTRRPASPNRPSLSIASTAACASSTFVATITPLPSASPSALITIGKCDSFRNARAASCFSKIAARAVGMCFARINSFAKIFDHSRRAADFVGPNIRRPSASKKSTMPLANGSSGPTTVRPMRFSFAKAANIGRSLALIATFSPISAVPAFPGAQNTRSTPGDCLSFQASACSRPPLPTTRIFTGTKRPRETSLAQVAAVPRRRDRRLVGTPRCGVRSAQRADPTIASVRRLSGFLATTVLDPTRNEQLLARLMNRVFLLSPAYAGGLRAKLIMSERAQFDLARRLRSEKPPALGEVFAFLSGLYFRGKLAYANAFAPPRRRRSSVLVITPTRGLLPAATPIGLADLQEFAAVDIHEGDPRYRAPLERDVKQLAKKLPADCEIVLLGSIATAKYVDVLLEHFGQRLCL